MSQRCVYKESCAAAGEDNPCKIPAKLSHFCKVCNYDNIKLIQRNLTKSLLQSSVDTYVWRAPLNVFFQRLRNDALIWTIHNCITLQTLKPFRLQVLARKWWITIMQKIYIHTLNLSYYCDTLLYFHNLVRFLQDSNTKIVLRLVRLF